MPEYDETAETVDEQSAVATAADDESVEAASEPEFRDRVDADEEYDPVAELRQKLRYAPGDWYVVHSYAGYENKVKTNLETRITSLDMEEFIYQVEVPTREEVEIKNGKRSQIQAKVFPGYILVRMDLTPESYSCVRNTPGVTGFVGATDRADRPAPLSLDEVRQVAGAGRGAAEQKTAKPEVRVLDFEVGDSVTRHRRRVRLAAGDDQRDQRRPAEAQGAGFDLRPGDAGRAQLQPGRQDLIGFGSGRAPHAYVRIRR